MTGKRIYNLKISNIAFLVFLLVSTVANSGGTNAIKLDDLYIPNEYFLEAERPFWLRYIKNLRPASDVLFIIDAEELANNIESYQAYDDRYKADIYVIFEFLNKNELDDFLDPNTITYSDPWYGRGLYQNRIIEKDPESGFYKVSSQAGHGVFWLATKISPSAQKEMPKNPFDFLVASCVDGKAPLTQSGKITTCDLRFAHQNVLIDASIDGFNLIRAEAIKSFLVKKLIEWKK